MNKHFLKYKIKLKPHYTRVVCADIAYSVRNIKQIIKDSKRMADDYI